MDGRADAQRWLEIAEKLLEARDYPAAKTFAERAIDSDPFFEGPDRVLAATDVLLADNNHYAVLQLPPSADLASIRRSYRRLALLLNSPSPVFADASRLVSDAFYCLSDDSLRRLYDIETSAHPPPPVKPRTPSPPPRAAAPPPPPPPKTFWTICPSCFRAFEYGKEYEGRKLLCQLCCKPFSAAALPSTPPTVPGTDMFYCSWGLFPVGFPGYSTVEIPPDTPSIPAFPYTVMLPEAKKGEEKDGGTPTRTSARLRATRGVVGTQKKAPRKAMAKRRRKQGRGGDCGGGFDMNAFSMDLEEDTSGVLGNLPDLPFLKDDDDIVMMN